MKKLFLVFLAAALALSITSCGSPSTSSSGTSSTGTPSSGTADTTYSFTVSNFYAAINNHGLLTQAWCDEITEQTNGRVTFEYYPGASLVSAANSYDSVKNGIVDIAMTATANTPGVFPAMSLLELPQGYANGWVGTMVCNDFANEYDLPEFNGVQLLYTHTVSPLVILSNREVKSMSDFKGMVIRSGSDLATSTISALGSQAYSCQITELYEALAKNMCEGALTGKDALDGFNLNEVTKYVLDDASYGKVAVVAMFMNEAKWNSLPDDIKEVFVQVSQEAAENQGKAWLYEDIAAYNTFKSKGGTVVQFDASMQAQLTELLSQVNSDYIANLEISSEQADEYIEYLTQRIEYWNAQVPTDEEIQAWADDYLIPLG